MYRVVTIQYMKVGTGLRRVISRGPMHPNASYVNRWAEYFRGLENYDEVFVETSKDSRMPDEKSEQRT